MIQGHLGYRIERISELESQLADKNMEISELKNEIVDLKSKLKDCQKQAEPEDKSQLEPRKD